MWPAALWTRQVTLCLKDLMMGRLCGLERLTAVVNDVEVLDRRKIPICGTLSPVTKSIVSDCFAQVLEDGVMYR